MAAGELQMSSTATFPLFSLCVIAPARLFSILICFWEGEGATLAEKDAFRLRVCRVWLFELEPDEEEHGTRQRLQCKFQ